MSENFSIEIVNPEKSFLSKDNVSEVVVSVSGGKNPGKDNTTSSNLTLPSIGFVGFSK